MRTQRHQRRARPLGDERARHAQHLLGEVSPAVQFRSGELGELLIIGLDEVGGGVGDDLAQRVARGVDGDEGCPRSVRGTDGLDDVDVEVGAGTRGQRSRQHQPPGTRALGDYGVDDAQRARPHRASRPGGSASLSCRTGP